MSPTLQKTCIALVLAVMTITVFYPVVHYRFVSYDDYNYVVENPQVNGGLSRQGIIWAFTTRHASNWHPIGWISHMIDCELFGLNPAGHHAVNVAIHVANVELLFFLLFLMTGSIWQSALIAALFAIHPLQVESVAWVAERKGVLSNFFWLTTAWTYVQYTRTKRSRTFILSLTAYVFGLMTKPLIMTLPVILLLLDYWPLGRITTLKSTDWKRILTEKIPYFILSAASAIATLTTHSASGSVISIANIGWMSRIKSALIAYLMYLVHIFRPVHLACPYPYDRPWPNWLSPMAAAVLLVITMLVLTRGRKHRYLITGWFWFFIMVLPVSTLFQAGLIGMADRYVYMAMVGILIMLVYGVSDWIENAHSKKSRKRLLYIISLPVVVILLLLCVQSRKQMKTWENSLTLAANAATVTPHNLSALNNWGQCLLEQGRLDEAMEKFQAARKVAPFHPKPMINIGVTLVSQGKLDKALEMYYRAMAMNPNIIELRLNIGTTLNKMGQYEEAVNMLLGALKMAPGDIRVHVELISAIPDLQDTASQIQAYREALDISPGWVPEMVRLARLLATQENTSAANREEALQLAEKAYRLEGGRDPDVIRTLAAAYAAAGFNARAIETATQAVKIAKQTGDPLLPEIRDQLKTYQHNTAEH